jgi:uncharacterized protein (DUF433 family)
MTLADTLVPTTPPIRIDQFGVARIGRSRLTLYTLLSAYNQGENAEELHEAFDSVSLSDIHAVIAYYLANKPAVDRYLADQKQEADEVRRQCEKRWPTQGLRERLLARKNKQSPPS